MTMGGCPQRSTVPRMASSNPSANSSSSSPVRSTRSWRDGTSAAPLVLGRADDVAQIVRVVRRCLGAAAFHGAVLAVPLGEHDADDAQLVLRVRQTHPYGAVAASQRAGH